MMKLSKISPDVLVYIQSLKKYFSINTDAQKYFSIENNEQKFFDQLTEISQKNYEENGEPELNIEQFEELRKELSDVTGSKNTFIASFINLGDLGRFSLN